MTTHHTKSISHFRTLTFTDVRASAKVFDKSFRIVAFSKHGVVLSNGQFVPADLLKKDPNNHRRYLLQ